MKITKIITLGLLMCNTNQPYSRQFITAIELEALKKQEEFSKFRQKLAHKMESQKQISQSKQCRSNNFFSNYIRSIREEAKIENEALWIREQQSKITNNYYNCIDRYTITRLNLREQLNALAAKNKILNEKPFPYDPIVFLANHENAAFYSLLYLFGSRLIVS